MTLLLPVALPAQQADQGTTDPDSSAALVGRVLSGVTAEPVVGAQVYLRRAARGAVTDSSGSFRLDDLPPGLDTLGVRYGGFEPGTRTLTLAPARTTRATFLLSERVFELAELDVVVRRLTTGEDRIERRRQSGLGHFITREEIEAQDPNLPSDMLRQLPRVSVQPVRMGGTAQVLVGRGTLVCEPHYYVDGVRMRDFALDEVAVEAIELLEIYTGPSEIPTEYRMNADRCGVIAVWTREGP
ncbi:MAG: carboxypeptidase regulatory-like domain-containing protein [Gemmatimonadota bacterium]